MTEANESGGESMRAELLATRTLAADLAADPADLLDLCATLGLEFRQVVHSLLRAPARAPEVVRSLGLPRRAGSPTTSAPFVWVSLVRAGHPEQTVRAGWLGPHAIAAITNEARAAGPDTEIRILVPLDGGDGMPARVHGLCLGFPLDLKVTVEVQRDAQRAGATPRRIRGSWRRPRDGGSPHDRGRSFGAGTWIVLHPAGATP